MTSEPPLDPLPPQSAGDDAEGRVTAPADASAGGGYSARAGSTAVPPPRPAPSSGGAFFDRMRSLQITRTPDRWIGGVAGGIAYRTGIDVILVRGILIVLGIFGGIGVLLYGLAWALLPEPDGRIHVESAARGNWTAGMTGALLVTIAGLWRPNLPFLGDNDGARVVLTLVWIGAAVFAVYWALSSSSRRTRAQGGGAPVFPGSSGAMGMTQQFPASAYQTGQPGPEQYPATETFPAGPPLSAAAGFAPAAGGFPPAGTGSTGYPPVDYTAPGYPPVDYLGSGSVPPGAMPPVFPPPRPVPPPRPQTPGPTGSVVALALGAAMLAVGTILALDYADLIDLDGTVLPVALAAGAAVLGIAIVALGFLGRSSGFVGFVAGACVFAAAVSSAVVSANFGDGATVVGSRTTLSAASVQGAEDGYTVVAGDSTIDLRGLGDLSGDVVIPVRVLASDVEFLIPDDVPVEVRSRLALGSVRTGEGAAATVYEGFWRPGTSELNENADGPSIILEVGGAASQVRVSQNQNGIEQ